MITDALNNVKSTFEPNFLQRFAIRLLSTAALPKHVVFVVDLNKQCTKTAQISELYKKFVANAVDIVTWLEYFDIPEITVYICEPKESEPTKGQMKNVMQAIKKISDHLPQLIDQLKLSETRFTFFGDLDLLPKNLRLIFAKAMLDTKQFKKNRFNMGFLYTSTDEMDLVVETLQKAVRNNELLIEDIDEKLIDHCLYTCESNTPELIIRLNTSQCFNDTFLWQQSNSMFTFYEMDTIEITFTQFLTVLFVAQYLNESYKSIANERIEANDTKNDVLNEEKAVDKRKRIERFYEKREKEFFDYLKEFVR